MDKPKRIVELLDSIYLLEPTAAPMFVLAQKLGNKTIPPPVEHYQLLEVKFTKDVNPGSSGWYKTYPGTSIEGDRSYFRKKIGIEVLRDIESEIIHKIEGTNFKDVSDLIYHRNIIFGRIDHLERLAKDIANIEDLAGYKVVDPGKYYGIRGIFTVGLLRHQKTYIHDEAMDREIIGFRGIDLFEVHGGIRLECGSEEDKIFDQYVVDLDLYYKLNNVARSEV